MISDDSRVQYDAIVAELIATSSTIAGKMFGMPCLKANGKTFAGFYSGAMVFKLAEPQHSEALALSDSRLFDPSGRGRPMKEWIVVPSKHAPLWMTFAQAALACIDKD